jgi:hypothetical protein
MSKPEKLLVIWSSADREVALHNVFMYTHNAKVRGWWDEVRLLLWGPSDRLLAEDAELQDGIRAMMVEGVEVLACKACSDRLGATEALEQLGVNVFYVGTTLTEMLKGGWTTLTY